MDEYEHCARTARELDRDRYIADLFAPQPARKHLFALHAFSAEVARIRDMVSDPVLGEIRLQWWRDALLGGGGGHPVATALIETIRAFALPLGGFEGLLDARIFDLYDDQMPSLRDLEGYTGETSSALIQLGAIVLAGGHDPRVAGAAGHAGVAYALTGLMRALPIHAARGQCYLPADIAAAHGFDRAMLGGRASDAGTARDPCRVARDRARSSRQGDAGDRRHAGFAEAGLPARGAGRAVARPHGSARLRPVLRQSGSRAVAAAVDHLAGVATLVATRRLPTPGRQASGRDRQAPARRSPGASPSRARAPSCASPDRQGSQYRGTGRN